MPSIWPAASRNGTIVNSTEMRVPSLRSAGHGEEIPVSVSALACFHDLPITVPVAGTQLLRDDVERLAPLASACVKPKMRAVPGFQNRITPSRSVPIIASAAAFRKPKPIIRLYHSLRCLMIKKRCAELPVSLPMRLHDARQLVELVERWWR